MSYIQVLILVVMACCTISTITGSIGYLLYNETSFSSQSVLPTMTRIQSTNLPFRTNTPQPTNTQTPTVIKLPTETNIISTPTLWFNINDHNLIPTEQEMPSGYKLYLPSSGNNSDQDRNYNQIVYTNDYPNNPSNKSGDPYLVLYTSSVYKTVELAISSYSKMTENWISSNTDRWFNVAEPISPSKVDYDIHSMERADAYISNLKGVSVPGFFVFIKTQSHNGVFTIITLSHAPYTDPQKAIASAHYFASLLIPKIVQ